MEIAASSDRRSDGDLFEFLTATSSGMCAADDVILAGKLLPFVAPPPPHPKKTKTRFTNFDETDHSRSKPLGEEQRGFFGGGSKVAGEYRKLNRVSGLDPEPKGTQMKPRPRWYVLDFGSVRIPAAMEMKEIRIRQRRRSSPPLAQPEAARDSGEWGPWKLLRSLSCKGMEVGIIS